MTLPIAVPKGFRIIAHRGASAYAPENTRAAFRLAREMGATEFELDAQLSTDGVIVLCHDTTLARYGHAPRVVEQMAWAELSSLDMGSWFSPHFFRGEPMLTLAELFAEHDDAVTYHVELKGKASGLPHAVHELIGRHGLQDHCIITSFAHNMLAASRTLRSSVRLGWLVPSVDAEVLAQARALRLHQLCPDAQLVTPDMVALAQTLTPEVRAWGLSGAHDEVVRSIHRVLDAGCDGMTINWPDWVRHGGMP